MIFSPESGITQERVLVAFREHNIDGRAFFAPLSMQAGFSKQKNTVAYDMCLRAVNVPSYHDLTDAGILRIVQVISMREKP